MVALGSDAMLRAEAAEIIPTLPPAVYLPPAIISLTGCNGFLNPAPLPNPAWLGGRISMDEYVQLVQSINDEMIRVNTGVVHDPLYNECRHLVRSVYGLQPHARYTREVGAQQALLQSRAWWLHERGLECKLSLGWGESIWVKGPMGPRIPGNRTQTTMTLTVLPQQPQAPAATDAAPARGAFCSACGAQSAAGAGRFCSSCGAAMA